MNYHARRFDRAAGTYAAHAEFQAAMAAKLMALSEGWADRMPAALIEFGCGTGLLTARLADRFPETPLAATDAAPRMLEEAARRLGSRGTLRFAICDAAGASPLPPVLARAQPYSLAASNAVVQWFPDLAGHLRWVRSLLAPGGLYLVSGFGRDNFPELNAILRGPPFGYRDFPGHDPALLPDLAAREGWDVLALETERTVAGFASPRAFLDAIRALGAARRPTERRPLTPGRMQALLREYRERYPLGEGIAATWTPWYAVLRNPGPASPAASAAPATFT